jgi:hypothetical protein
VGLDFWLARGFRISAELGWRRYFFEGGQFPRDLRGLWLGFSLG